MSNADNCLSQKSQLSSIKVQYFLLFAFVLATTERSLLVAFLRIIRSSAFSLDPFPTPPGTYQ